MTDTMPNIPVAGQEPWDQDLNACLTWLSDHVETLEEVVDAAEGVPGPQGDPGPPGPPGEDVDPAVAEQVATNTANIAANQQGIVNLNNDLGAMFGRLAEVETQAGVNANNINSLGERIAALEARVTALEATQ